MFCYPCKEQNIDNKKKTNNNTDLIPTATPDTITLGKPKYGFNNNFSEVLNNLREEFSGLLELTDTYQRLSREYELLDHTRRQLAARTALKDTFSNADQANN